MMADYEWGRYVVVRIGHPIREEWTNVGIIVFDSNNQQVDARMDSLDRAIARGDADTDAETAAYVRDYPKSLPDIVTVERRLGSDGHAMSNVQITPPRGTGMAIAADCLDRLWQSFFPTP